MKKSFIILAMSLIFSSIFAQEAKSIPDFVFANGIGETITAIEVRAKKGKSALALSSIEFANKDKLEINLPDDMKGMTEFKVSLEYGKKKIKAKTKKIFDISTNEKSVFVLTIQGEPSAIPLMVAGALTGNGLIFTKRVGPKVLEIIPVDLTK
ncbi:MAG: hypothetical protein ACRC4W_06165 [Treponemataceae bacterium]